MPIDSKLYAEEDTLKEKYLGLVNQMTHMELKKFKKHEYKKIILKEIMTSLPDCNKDRLEQTAQCVANFLAREVRSLISRSSRESTPNTSSLLSTSVLQDLEKTMHADGADVIDIQPDANFVVDNDDSNDDDGYDDDDNDDGDENDNKANIEPPDNLNDSITKLKQAINIETKSLKTTAEPKTDPKASKKNSKCCDTCKIKPSSKKCDVNRIQCPLCVHWYHETCVGISNGDPIGLWFCLAYRGIPTALKHDISILKVDVQQLKECTQTILEAVNGLTAKIESNFDNLNDRLTSLKRNINANDISISESLETLTSTTNSLKTSFDQKACQIVNKTAAVFEKLKSQTENLKTTTEKSQKIQKPEANKTRLNSNSLITKSNSIKQRKEANSQRANLRATNTNLKQRKQKPVRSLQAAPDTEINLEIVDLTDTPKKVISQSTLLVGSSILKGVKNIDLKTNTTVRSFSGATTETLKKRLERFDINNCKTIILHVGGNDADNGKDLDTFYKNYQNLLNELGSEERKIIVSGLFPRESVDLEPYNDQLKALCAENDITFIDHFDEFLLASGELPDAYFQTDKTHLNKSGTRKCLRNIDKIYKVTGSAAPRKAFQSYPQSNKPHVDKRYKPRSRYCHICSMNNHSTHECWFNGRNTGRSGHVTR